MPRQAHGRSLLEVRSSKVRKRKSARGRGLNALEEAEKQFPDQLKIRQHRLGEAEDDDDNPNGRTDRDERSAKRRKTENHIDQADEEDEGSDPDGNLWHVGVDDDDEDSDIDSDEAFGESDEERFAHFTFRGSGQNDVKQPKPKSESKSKSKSADTRLHPQNFNLDEDALDEAENDVNRFSDPDDLSEDDDLGDDAIDLAAAWDMDDEEQRKEEEQMAAKTAKPKFHSIRPPPTPSFDSSEASAQSSSEGQSDKDISDDASADEEEEDGDTIARLRTFVDGLTPAQETKPQRHSSRAPQNLPAKPSQFAAPSAGISAADLIQYVKDPAQRQSLKILQAAEREEPTNYKGGIPGKLAAPLAKRQQDRLDRGAAYDQSKKTMERWVDTVKTNRRAEHLSFPLVDPVKASASNIKHFQALSKNEPQSELESKIQEIMAESGYNVASNQDAEGDELIYEELKEKQIPLEEVQARRQELRMQRELMFREEIRAKRIKKIKSKAYRRVHRKERDKFAVQERERMAAAGIIDSDDEREQTDRKRAEVRMGARHRESKWAKAAKASGQTVWNEDAKAGVSDLARRDEELRRRVEGKNVRGSDDSGAESNTESDDIDSDDADVNWNQKLDSVEEVARSKGKSKLADMAFMQKAEAAQKAENDEELRVLRRAMNGDHISAECGSDVEEASLRQRYGKASTKQIKASTPHLPLQDFEERLSDDEALDEGPDSTLSTEQPKAGRSAVTASGGAKLEATKWEARAAPHVSANPPQFNDSIILKPSNLQQSTLDDYTSPSESDNDQDRHLDDKDQLALDIFAGEDEADLRQQFKKEKKEAVEEEGDQVIDNTLPGWGSWTGVGISKREQKKGKGRFLTTIKGIAPESRKDAALDRVIINEKRIKKNDKYLATELPHPFESRQQYERSLRLPMGPEWSTRNHFQGAIKPRVLLKQGQVIKPMARPSV